MKAVVVVAGATLFLLITFVIAWKYYEKQAEKDVSNERPNDFPVVVISPGKSELVFLKDLESYEQQHPEHTFLISPERLDLINSQLQADQAKRHGKGIPKIRAIDLGGERQLIEFEIMSDGLFRSKYEASTDDVRPMSLTITGPGFVFMPCGLTMLVGFVGLIFLRLLSWWSGNKRVVAES